jgi:dihydroxy-acid dehydratase
VKELLPLLEPECVNVEGKSIKDIALGAHNMDPTVIRSLKNPVSKQGGIAILKGNIARHGAALRLSTVPEGMMKFTGTAIVFNSEEQATEAVEANKIAEGSVVVVRYEGPIGGPGMREMHRLAGVFYGLRIVIVTDGRFSGATGGLSIGYLSPEAAQCGEIACVEDGDEITIDIERRSIELNLDTEIIKDRMRRLKPRKGREGTRLLWNYAQNMKSILN